MDFSAFDKKQLDEYAGQAKAAWGNTWKYQEFQEKSKVRAPEEDRHLGEQFMLLFKEFGKIRETDPASEEAQVLVAKLQGYITEHFYKCSDQILSRLGKMYVGGGDFTRNIDEAGGEGTAEFTNKAIQIHCD